MILQSLVDYYDRADLAPPGWEYKAIPFFIVLDRTGSVVSVESRIDTEYPRGRPILVPQSEIRSGKNAWAKPNLLWDHYGFVLGEQKRKSNGDIDTADTIEKAKKQLVAFVARVQSLVAECPGYSGLLAIVEFYRRGEHSRIFTRADAMTMVRTVGANLTFRIVDAIEPVLHESWIQNCVSWVDASEGDDGSSAALSGMCLVSGRMEEIARLHPKIYGVCDKPSPLVAANTKVAPAYSSYGKEQGYIFPIGKSSASAYTTALNHLLRKGSRQRIQIGDASTVFWAERETEFETRIPGLFAEFQDDPDAHADAVRSLYAAIDDTGKWALPEGDSVMHVLGLAPNAARISVRFYHRLPLHALATDVLQYFKDLEIARGPNDPTYPSLYRLLQSVCLVTKSKPFGDIEKLPPNLAGAIMNAVFAGPDVPFPSLWLNVAISRCRVERTVNYLRAAIIKACLNRSIRRIAASATYPFLEKELQPVLDLTNTNTAYLLGRLFAVLERAQEIAQGDVNATIRDRFYGAASSTPVAVFSTLLRLKAAHLKKMTHRDVVWIEAMVGEVFNGITDFPKHLSLPDQGRFAVGYYHQRRFIFTKKPATDTVTHPNDTSEGK